MAQDHWASDVFKKYEIEYCCGGKWPLELEDFLSLGKHNEGKVETHCDEFDLKEFMADTIDEMKGLLKKGQQFIYHHEGNLQVFSDKKLLKNIIINLAGNAIKFSEEYKPIEIKSRATNGKMDIFITDKGIGVSTEDQGHLFSSF